MAQNTGAVTITGSANNPRFRAQRLYLKLEHCMRVANEIMTDKTQTYIPTWLSAQDLEIFKGAVRTAVRTEIDATMDSWPQSRAHNYLPIARKAILDSINSKWELFMVAEFDDFVLSELVYEKFYKD
ncbi:hypothetical protein KJ359_012773 [Pestalotiopsis sp. 9143b]|nr:hypothetical protein KJ359_012773 [Pestalotiopsis sp. 9143b]